jgi:serine/threonine-protein kinase
MARVWAARLHGQRAFQKLVAIKVILPHLADEAEFERMFLDEARIASGVHHPNVCEIYELGEDQSTLYLAMEWVSGDSFARILRPAGERKAIEPRTVARLLADACAGAHAAHELTDEYGRALGVVHRDLSPHNILVSADGIAKVCDFGVAKALDQLHEATTAGQLKGKISYMAPEQIAGGAVDRRCDVFSLGCVLYEATTGERPFRGDGDAQIMHAVLKGEFVPPRLLVHGYPPELERIVVTALAAQPDYRFPTAEHMRYALEEYLARGELVTQANIAQVVRARIGDVIERRKERIRKAAVAGDTDGGWSDVPAGFTPSNRHRSGVKASSSLQMNDPSVFARAPMATVTMHAASVEELVRRADAENSATGAPVTAPLPQGLPGTLTATHAAPVQPAPFPSFAQTVEVDGARFTTPLNREALPSAGTALYAAVPMAAPSAPAASMSALESGPRPASTPPNAGGGRFDATRLMASPVPPAFDAMPSAPPALTYPPVGEPQAPPQFAFEPLHAPSEEPRGGGSYWLACAVGVLVAVVVGVGGYLFWRSREARLTAEPAANVAGTTTGQVPSTKPPTATPPAETQAPPVATPIVVELSPAEASVTVDGQPLVGTTIPRPKVGTTVEVLAHAKGYEDLTTTIDALTESPVALRLKVVPPAQPNAPTPAVTRPAPPIRRVVREPAAVPKSPAVVPHPTPAPTKESGLPANPY